MGDLGLKQPSMGEWDVQAQEKSHLTGAGAGGLKGPQESLGDFIHNKEA